MKTAELKIRRIQAVMVITIVLMSPKPLFASWNLSVDGDVRSRFSDWEEHEANIHIVGASVRKTFSDNRGDRFILFGLAEAEDNFSDWMLHEIYGQYKGPLGVWNLTAGRFGLPWGLLPGFSASRLLYEMPHGALLGMDVDSGLKFSGVSGPWDYAISVTQGYGPHHTPDDIGHGLVVARIGFTPGVTEEISFGLSAAWGESITAHHSEDHTDMDEDMPIRRGLGGLDATFYLGRWLGRVELSSGRVNHRSLTAGFAAIDYALLPRLDITFAANVKWHGQEYEDTWFVGFTGKLPWFTIRGGYRYADHSATRNEITLQLYRLFSYSY